MSQSMDVRVSFTPYMKIDVNSLWWTNIRARDDIWAWVVTDQASLSDLVKRRV